MDGKSMERRRLIGGINEAGQIWSGEREREREREGGREGDREQNRK